MNALKSLILFLLISAGTAFAACPTMTIEAETPVHNFASDDNVTLEVEVRRSNSNDNCDYFVGFGPGAAGSYSPRRMYNGTNSMTYNIHRSSSTNSDVFKDWPTASSDDEIREGEFDRNSGSNSRDHSYRAILTSGFSAFDNKRFGTYTDTITIKLYESSFPPSGTPFVRDTTTSTFYYTVPKQILFSLTCTGCGYTSPPNTVRNINFGTLTTGQQQTFDMVLVYNAGYEIKMNSTNGSRLKHTSQNTYVNYTMAVNNSNVSLPAGSTVTVASGFGVSPSAPQGDPVPVKITIGSTTGAMSGTYQDVVTITVNSIE